MTSLGSREHEILGLVRRERALLRFATAVSVALGCLGILLIYGPVAWLGLMSISARFRSAGIVDFSIWGSVC